VPRCPLKVGTGEGVKYHSKEEESRMMKRVLLLLTVLGCVVLPVLAEPDNTDGSLWNHNAKTPDGKSYLDGFVRGYIEGRRWGIEMMEGTLPYARFDFSSPIDKNQIESRLLMETVYYSRALEETNFKTTVDQVTEWYQDAENWRITWIKLVDLAIGKVNGYHMTYIRYQLKWLRESSNQKRIDWFHTIDPATGKGLVKHYDKEGKVVRVEVVK
jgi:hypothetical protein